MKTGFSGVLVLALGILSAAIPAVAHHSFAAEYDQKQPITLKGVVTHLDWMNPHVYFYVDATDKDGKVTRWACEAGNPNALARRGWKKDSLKEGDQITVQAFRAKDGSNTVNARSITLADGKQVVSFRWARCYIGSGFRRSRSRPPV
jgi:hypothetical protein